MEFVFILLQPSSKYSKVAARSCQVHVKLFKGGLKIRIRTLIKCLVMAMAMMIIIELEYDFTMVDVSNNDNGTAQR